MENQKNQEIDTNILVNLNKEQKLAVIQNDRPLRIIAGAGSGKTNVLTKKIAFLIKVLKANPVNIIALTFSNKAANEMRERVRLLVGDLASKCVISTFHSLCTRILRYDIDKMNISSNFVILDMRDQKEIIQAIYKELGISAQIIPIKNTKEFISHWKIQNIPAEEINIDEDNEIEAEMKKVFILYNKYLESRSYLDFDSLLVYAYNLLRDYPAVRKKWSSRIHYLLIDEFQDTSDLQYDIIKLLIDENFKNITIVGDPDQTIYSWRGANISLINNFDKDFVNTHTIVLALNYRSDRKIIECANKLISKNKMRMKKELISNSLDEGAINFYQAKSVEREANWVVGKINALKQNKTQLKDICILYRSNYYSRSIEEALINESIAFNILGSQRFYDRSEINHSFSFLRSIYDFDDLYLLRIINIPQRRIGEKTKESLIAFARSKNLPILEAFKQHYKEWKISEEIKKSVFKLFISIIKHNQMLKEDRYNFAEIFQNFLKEIGFLEMLQRQSDENESYQNVLELIKSMQKWILNNPDKKLIDYMEDISLTALHSEHENALSSVMLMTIHAVKGLEFKNVFVLGLNEEIFPISRAIDNPKDKLKLEEERRLAYVAITRAKNNLYLSCSSGYNFNNEPKRASRFLKEMGIKVDNESSSLVSYLHTNNVEFEIGDKINHLIFGLGTVVDLEGDLITIKFKKREYGIKKLLKNHKNIEKEIINE